MKYLFLTECKKIVTSISYWLYIAALSATVILNYNPVVTNELEQANSPASVFYTAKDGVYAKTNEKQMEMQHTMMIGAVKRLFNSYKNNSYEYYPFGYVKEKTLSQKDQETIRSYLQELTGSNELSINEKEGTNNSEDFQISGGGAFILKPGQGNTNENGQFITEPGDWEYTENEPDINSSKTSENELNIQVTFNRFKEIMESVNDLIGGNSYFSWTMLTMYYYENDMQNTPITELQHKNFYEKDFVTGAFARYFCDSISLVVLCLPAFVIIDLLLKDKRHKIKSLIYHRTESSAKIIGARFAAAICLTMLPILILPLKSLITLIIYCSSIGIHADLFAFAAYTFAWILPTVLFVTAIGLFVTVLTENYLSILLSGLIWIFGRPSIEKIAGGNYGLFDLVIRHNTLKGYEKMIEHIQTLIWNRLLISAFSLILVAFTILIYDAKRKGGLTFEYKKPAHNHHCKHSHEL